MPDLKKVTVNGAQLYYLQQGSGPPLVLVHGDLDDHRSCQAALLGFLRRQPPAAQP